MGEKKRFRNGFFAYSLFVVVLICSLYFVFAAHIIKTSTDGNSFSVNQSSNTIFNISVNNTDAGQDANITQVNITLPSGFTLVSGTNGTDSASAHAFYNSSTRILSWTNYTTYVINGSTKNFFWFNATASSTPGTYYINVTTLNWTSGFANSTNVSVVVNDTTNPIASLGTNPVAAYNSSNGSMTFDLKCSDNYNVSVVQLWSNWSGTWSANQTNSSPINDSWWNVSVATIPEGLGAIWGVYCNDSAGNSHWSSNRTLNVDKTAPSASASCTPSTVSTGSTVTCTCSGTDTLSGVASYTNSSTPSTVNTGSFTYGCTVTDVAGNSASTSATYIVEMGSTGSTGGSGGGSSQSTFWTKGTYPISNEQFLGGHTMGVLAKQRVQVVVEGVNHYVGVKEMTSTSAKIEVSSVPQEKVLLVGEEWKVDLASDGYYDMILRLVSLESNKANIFTQSIRELIPVDEPSEEVLDSGITGNVVDENVNEEVPSESGGGAILWIVIAVVVVVIAGVAVFLVKKGKGKRH